MILSTLAGWALQRFAGVPHAAAIAFLAGLIGARFVPGPGTCPLPRS